MKLTLLAVTTLVLAGSAHASQIFFGGGGGDLGVSSKTFSNGPISVIVTGYSSNNNQVNLYSKGAASTGTEDGLGLTNDPTGDHEIQGTSFIQIDISSLTGPIQISMGSTSGD